MQALVTINDTSEFPKILENYDILEHNFAFVIDKKIKLAFRDWQYSNYAKIKEKFKDPIYVYDYGSYDDTGACASYRKAFYYFQVFDKFDLWKPVVITRIDYVKHSDMLSEKIHNTPKLHDGLLLDNDLAVSFYWYTAMRFCHAVDDRDKKQITKYNQLQLLQALAQGEHNELAPMDFAVVDLETQEVEV